MRTFLGKTGIRRCLILFLMVFLFLPSTAPVQAQTSYPNCVRNNELYPSAPRCGEGTGAERLAQSSAYGPFLCGVCNTCIESGNCTLADTMIVVGNVGNFLLGLVGSLALLMFVIGGVTYLTSQGSPDKVKKGTQFITAAAIGIGISLGAFVILGAVISTITKGSVGSSSSSGIICTNADEGKSCGTNQQCHNGTCQSLCEINNSNSSSFVCMVPIPNQAFCTPNQCADVNQSCCNQAPSDTWTTPQPTEPLP